MVFLVVLKKATVGGICVTGAYVKNRNCHFASYMLTTSWDDWSSFLPVWLCYSFR
jgi:hypothetical protein